MGATGSAFVRRQVGWHLERARRDAGISTANVETSGIITRQHLWRIENGLSAARWTTVSALCDLYGADEDTKQALVEAAKAKGGGWFERSSDAVPAGLAFYFGAELNASRISTYDPEVIHGVLQTADYMRALFLGENPGSPPEHIEALLDARSPRKEAFWAGRPDGAIFSTVLNQAALAREVGDRAIMARQVEHLRELGRREGVEIRILPWSAGAHRAIYGGFTIFQFPGSRDPTVAYMENYKGGTFHDDNASVMRMLGVLNSLIKQSIPLEEYH